VVRIDIDHHQLLGTHAEICFGYAQAPPQFDNACLGGGRQKAVRSVALDGMLRGFFTAEAAAGAGFLAVVFDRPVQRKDCISMTREGERSPEDIVAHAVPPFLAPKTKSLQKPSARARPTSRLIRFAVALANSRRCDGVSKCGLMAAKEIRQTVSASSVSP